MDPTDEEVIRDFGDDERCKEQRYQEAIVICPPEGEMSLSDLRELRDRISKIHAENERIEVRVYPISEWGFAIGKSKEEFSQTIGLPDYCEGKNHGAEDYNGNVSLIENTEEKEPEPTCAEMPVWVYSFVEEGKEAPFKLDGLGWSAHFEFDEDGVCTSVVRSDEKGI